MNKDYLTVKEFAVRIGITPQALYKRLNSDLKPYVLKVENKKYLKTSALQFFFNQSKDDKLKENEVENLVESEVERKKNTKTVELKDESSAVMALLREQLQTKDKQIEKLQIDLTDTRTQLSKIADQAQQLQLAQLKLLPHKENEERQDNGERKPNYWKGVSIGLMAILTIGVIVLILFFYGIF